MCIYDDALIKGKTLATHRFFFKF